MPMALGLLNVEKNISQCETILLIICFRLSKHNFLAYASVRKEIMESISTESLSLQAQQIWAMLDDMSENNPAAYRKFIQRQMDEAREHMSLPDPHMCVQVTLLVRAHLIFFFIPFSV